MAEKEPLLDINMLSKQCVCLVLQNLKLTLTPALIDQINESTNQVKAYLESKIKPL